MGEVLAFARRAAAEGGDRGGKDLEVAPDAGRMAELESLLCAHTDELRRAYLAKMALSTTLLGHRAVMVASQIATLRGVDAGLAGEARRDLEAMAMDEATAHEASSVERAMALTLSAMRHLRRPWRPEARA